MRVKTNEMCSHIKRCSNFTSSMANDVTLKTENGICNIECCDWEKWYKGSVTVIDWGELNATVDQKNFSSILQLCKNDEIEISVSWVVIVKDWKNEYEISIRDQWFPVKYTWDVTEYDVSNIIDAIKEVNSFVPNKSFSPILTCVYLGWKTNYDWTEKWIDVVWTNGFSLSKVQLNWELDVSITIPWGIVDSLEDWNVKMKIDNKLIEFIYDNYTVGSLIVQWAYPDYQKLFESLPNMDWLVEIDVKKFAEYLKAISLYNEYVSISLIDWKPIVLSAWKKYRTKIETDFVYHGESKDDILLKIKDIITACKWKDTVELQSFNGTTEFLLKDYDNRVVMMKNAIS